MVTSVETFTIKSSQVFMHLVQIKFNPVPNFRKNKKKIMRVSEERSVSTQECDTEAMETSGGGEAWISGGQEDEFDNLVRLEDLKDSVWPFSDYHAPALETKKMTFVT